MFSNYCWTWGHMLWFQVHISRKVCFCDQVNVEPECDQIINWWCITKFRVQSAASGQQVSAADALMLCASECCTGQGIRLWAQCTTSARAITPMIVLFSSYHAASIGASSTQLGMHWFYALLHEEQHVSWSADGVRAMLNAVCLGASNLTLTSWTELTATGQVAVSWYMQLS